MSNVFIFHGITGSSQENWFPWMTEKLQEDGVEVICPDFPNTNEPHLNEWIDHFRQYQGRINQDSIIIGHSMGLAFALNVIQELNNKIKVLYAIGPVWKEMGNDFDPLMKEFVAGSFDWEKIQGLCDQVEVWNSDNDPYIKLEDAKELAEKLEAKFRFFPGQGHFNISMDPKYKEFEELLLSVMSTNRE